MRLKLYLSVLWVASTNAWVAPNHQSSQIINFQQSPPTKLEQSAPIGNNDFSRRSTLAILLGLPLIFHPNSVALAADDPLDAFGKALSSQAPSSTMTPPSSDFPFASVNSQSNLQKSTSSESSGAVAPGGSVPQSTPQTLQGFMDKASKKKRIDPRTHG